MANSFEDAAYILRELRERVDRNQEERTQSGPVNIFRGVEDSALARDSTTVTVEQSGSATWDQDDWDHTEGA